MHQHQQKESGFVRLIIFLIVAIILASYFFKFDIKRAVEDPQTQTNFEYLKEQGTIFYSQYLKKYLKREASQSQSENNTEEALLDSDTPSNYEN